MGMKFLRLKCDIFTRTKRGRPAQITDLLVLRQVLNLQYQINIPKETKTYDEAKKMDIVKKVDENDFLKTIQTSKYSLDLNGAGNPNKRTFEILTNNSLLISEFNNLTWPFPEKFCEETIIKNGEEFMIKLGNLHNNNSLYQKCFDVQQNIVDKYFNINWLRNYICFIF